MPSPTTSDFSEQGYTVLPPVIEASTVENLLGELKAFEQEALSTGTEQMYALRNLFRLLPSVCSIATSQSLKGIAERYLGEECHAVRAIYFDKIPEANWRVPWHQDLTVALKQRVESEGFSAWSLKAGVVHAQAPAWLLERMITLRLHLDPCEAENAPLRVLPGTHIYGKLTSEQIANFRAERPEAICEVERGGVLVKIGRAHV